jgi:hypothetical protein
MLRDISDASKNKPQELNRAAEFSKLLSETMTLLSSTPHCARKELNTIGSDALDGRGRMTPHARGNSIPFYFRHMCIELCCETVKNALPTRRQEKKKQDSHKPSRFGKVQTESE